MSLPVRPLAFTNGWMLSNSRWNSAATMAGCRFVFAHISTRSAIRSGTYVLGAGWKLVPVISTSTLRYTPLVARSLASANTSSWTRLMSASESGAHPGTTECRNLSAANPPSACLMSSSRPST